MVNKSLVLVGYPDTGKTNYLARLWATINEGDRAIRAIELPQNIRYVDRALECLLQGEFAPRTESAEDESHRSITVSVERREDDGIIELNIPDVSGELWRESVSSYELPVTWMRKLNQSFGALLFVRVGSEQNTYPLDWVTSKKWMALDTQNVESNELPTAVQLCELVRFLELALGKEHAYPRPRVAVLVTAWDLVNEQEASDGPRAFLKKEFPLFAGRINNVKSLEIEVFGVSIVGGDLDSDKVFKEQFLSQNRVETSGHVVFEHNETIEVSKDLTIPIEWVLSA